MVKIAGIAVMFVLSAGMALSADPVSPRGVGVAGWRTDGTGCYPNAEPPTEWSSTKNVVWKTPMPSWSNATPVLVGDKIFVCSEPFNLLCLDKADGTLLWTAAHDYSDVMTEADRRQAEQDKLQAAEVRKELAPVNQQLRKVQTEAQTLRRNKTPTEAEKARLAELQEQAKVLGKRVEELEARLEPFTTWEKPGTHNTNGYSSATPVSNGRIVAALFGNGVAGVYDLDGKRLWARFIEKTPHRTWGHSASPVLLGDTLLVHMKDLVALDARTGEELWRHEQSTYHWGTPAVVRVGQTDVAVTELGDVVRIGDGKVLAKGLSRLTYNAPVVRDGVAYFIQSGGKAVRLSPKGDDEVAAEALWTTKPKNDRYYASPIVMDGRIYAVTQANHYSVIDAATGQVLAEKDLPLGKGTNYPSLSCAGGLLFVSSDNGATVLMRPGTEMQLVATNSLGEPFRSSPVFDGTRMYLRGYKHLYCIGK